MDDSLRSVDPADVPADAQLFDVREQDEWDAGHAPAARHLPASELAARLGRVSLTVGEARGMMSG